MNFSGVNYWKPRGEGSDFELSPILTPLAPFRDQMVVVSGLDAPPGRRAPRRRQRRSHARHEHVADRRASRSTPKAPTSTTGSRPIRSPRARSARTRALPSLELGIDLNYLVGQLRERLQLRLHEHAVVALGRRRRCRPRTIRASCSSGCSATAARRRSGSRRRSENRSILDSVTEEWRACSSTLGADDRTEGRRLRRCGARDRAAHPERRAARDTSELPALERPTGIPERFDEHVALMFDLQWLAFQADITRVITFMLGRELNFRTYPEIGITEGHHGLSHHGDNPEQMAQLREAQHVSGAALRVVPREAARDAGRRRHAARSLAVPLRRRPEQLRTCTRTTTCRWPSSAAA